MTEDIEREKEQIKCPKCKSICQNDYQYKLHKELYCDVGYQCKQCSERFKRVSLLATHLKLAHSANSGGKSREILIPNMSIVKQDVQSVPSSEQQFKIFTT